MHTRFIGRAPRGLESSKAYTIFGNHILIHPTHKIACTACMCVATDVYMRRVLHKTNNTYLYNYIRVNVYALYSIHT